MAVSLHRNTKHAQHAKYYAELQGSITFTPLGGGGGMAETALASLHRLRTGSVTVTHDPPDRDQALLTVVGDGPSLTYRRSGVAVSEL